MEAYKRNAREGKPGWNIRNEDRRYKNWEIVTEPQRNAVIFAMRDVSGSMGEFEAYICRSFYFWMLRFLRTKYTSAEIVFRGVCSDCSEPSHENETEGKAYV